MRYAGVGHGAAQEGDTQHPQSKPTPSSDLAQLSRKSTFGIGVRVPSPQQLDANLSPQVWVDWEKNPPR
ncbi:hypothetical protein IFM47457_01651 [Aspergillus lentulus]|nr:hypothetical protein IFM47457_01651 [Aspergillus lentulus]